MKAHVGVDSKSKLIHAVVATAANVHDTTVLPDLLHGGETRVWGDQAYRGQTDLSANMRRMPATSPTAGIGTAAWLTRRRRRKTGRNRAVRSAHPSASAARSRPASP